MADQFAQGVPGGNPFIYLPAMNAPMMAYVNVANNGAYAPSPPSFLPGNPAPSDMFHAHTRIINSFKNMREAQQIKMSKVESRYKTELCHGFYNKGRCKYGAKCKFAHGINELRLMHRHPMYKTELCHAFHTLGTCPYGTRCQFIHNLEEGEAVCHMQKRMLFNYATHKNLACPLVLQSTPEYIAKMNQSFVPEAWFGNPDQDHGAPPSECPSYEGQAMGDAHQYSSNGYGGMDCSQQTASTGLESMDCAQQPPPYGDMDWPQLPTSKGLEYNNWAQQPGLKSFKGIGDAHQVDASSARKAAPSDRPSSLSLKPTKKNSGFTQDGFPLAELLGATPKGLMYAYPQ